MPTMSRVVPPQTVTVNQGQLAEVNLMNPNISVDKSVFLMKQLTIVSISSIAYLRGIFPEDSFEPKKLAGQKVFVLKGSENLLNANTLINWIKSAFELVHSHNLQKMILVLKKESKILEIYTFKFSYNDDAIQCDLQSEIEGKKVVLEGSQSLPELPEDIAKCVRHLVRNILTHTSILEPLPDGAELSIKLIVSGSAAKEVIPECFKICPEEVEDYMFPEEAETLKLGKVESKFTTFSVSVKTVMNGIYSNDQDISQDLEDEVPSSQLEPFNLASLASLTSQKSRSQKSDRLVIDGNKAPENDSNTTNLSEKLSIVSLKEKTVCCICECSDEFDEIIRCVSCATYQHKACYKLQQCHNVDSHICVKCHNPSMGRCCSQPDLLSETNKKESALYRQALMYCRNSSQVSCKRLMTHLKVPRRIAEKIMKQLDTDGFLELTINNRSVRSVKPNFEETILSRYFSAPPVADCSPMEVQNSSSANVLCEGNKNTKRQLSENTETSSPGNIPPQQKRRKILAATTILKKPLRM